MRHFISLLLLVMTLPLGNLFAGENAPEANVNSKPKSAAVAKKRIAAIVTIYRHNSHADVIVSRVMEGYAIKNRPPGPRLQLVSLYTDQHAKDDLGRKLAKKHRVPIFDTVEKALTLGTGKLAVDGVLLIAEHGSYPRSKTEQTEYPKRRLFTEIVRVFERSGRVVPVFCDKHLSDNWADAKWIYDTAQRMKIPLMAGSSLPSYRRLPEINIRRGAKVKEILAVNYGGVEAYGFHSLEMLQCLVERRHGGETGVKSVRCLEGDDVWKAGLRGDYDPKLLEAALNCEPGRSDPNRLLKDATKDPVVFLVEYNDGLKASVVKLTGVAHEFTVAWKYAADDKIESTLFALQNARPYMHFAYLLRGIDKMVHSGHPTWPAERTLLTTGVLNAAMISKTSGGKMIPTPYLDVRYQSDWIWTQPPPAEVDLAR